MSKKAFTLLELLVLMVILGVLAVILLPVIGSSREAAKRVQCANNLRQHGIAWSMYLDEHNDFFPQYDWPPTSCPPSEGGANEVLRDVIAMLDLGLPRTR